LLLFGKISLFGMASSPSLLFFDLGSIIQHNGSTEAVPTRF
jgi:hypothetical protein